MLMWSTTKDEPNIADSCPLTKRGFLQLHSADDSIVTWPTNVAESTREMGIVVLEHSGP